MSLEVKNLVKKYGDKVVVNNLSFQSVCTSWNKWSRKNNDIAYYAGDAFT